MITINSNGRFCIPDEDVFIGFAGDNLNVKREFFLEGVTDPTTIYRMYLLFDDGTSNFFLLDKELMETGTKLIWDIESDQIFKSGIVILQIKGTNNQGKIFHTCQTSLVVQKSIEFSESYNTIVNSEFLQHEEDLNDFLGKVNSIKAEAETLYEKIKDADIDSTPTENSDSPVASGGVYSSLKAKLDDTDNSVKSNNLVDSAVTSDKLSDNAVTSGKLSDNSVTSDKISDSAVTSTKIADGAVSRGKLGYEAVSDSHQIAGGVIKGYTAQYDRGHIAEKTITAYNLADNAVATEKIVDNAVTSGKIMDRAVGFEKLDKDTMIDTSSNSSMAYALASDSHIPTTGFVKVINEGTLEKLENKLDDTDNSVKNNNIVDKAVTTDKIDTKAITADKIAEGAVWTEHIKNSSVTGDKIEALSISKSHLATDLQEEILSKLDISICSYGTDLADCTDKNKIYYFPVGLTTLNGTKLDTIGAGDYVGFIKRVNSGWLFISSGEGNRKNNAVIGTGGTIEVIADTEPVENSTNYITSGAVAKVVSDLKADVKNLSEKTPSVLTVKKDGTGDFSTLKEAVDYSRSHSDLTIQVYEGTYDLIEEFGEEYFTNLSGTSQRRGLQIGNGVHLIFSSGSKVVCHYQGNNETVKTCFSPFNYIQGTKGFTLENLTLEASNVRYAIHDEAGSSTLNMYRNTYKNCKITIDNSNNEVWKKHKCIGGGLGLQGEIIIENCSFTDMYNVGSKVSTVSYHNAVSEGAKSRIIVTGCYFSDNATFSLAYYGNSTEITEAYVNNCSMTYEPYVTAESSAYTIENVKLIMWNNEIRNL